MTAPLKNILFLLLSFLLLFRCNKEGSDQKIEAPPIKETLFVLKHPVETKINFSNNLTEGLNTNILMYEYFYNGAGVATADFNNDGLIDIYFSSNMEENKLFLNTGKFTFKDVTADAGVSGRKGPWKTGVTFADVNGDGLLDIYLCYSGTVKEENRANQLFINKGNNASNVPQFSEEADAYGLASRAYSNQGYFFDYDRDGDLDMFLLNHNPHSLPVLNEVSTKEILKKDDPLSGVRLFKQTNNHFEDVTVKSGINGSALTYGLGAGISDINNDGWPDIYLSNDYAIPDYLYINNGNGTFSDKLKTSIGHTSQFSMGNDVADINDDGAMDVITLDMLPEDNARQKLLMMPDNYAKFELNLRSGFHYQYMRNMLQVNNNDGTFSEVGQYAGISNTDWSWAALFADYNNDGLKDLLVTNGYLRDYTNLDFIKYMDSYVQQKGRLKRQDVLELIRHMPSSNVTNYIFSNSGALKFNDATERWGLNRSSNSNGASYADLDNDGDLDLVINNINEIAFVYENLSDQQPGNFLTVSLEGEGKNTLGIGAKVSVWTNGKLNFLEQMPARGYLSAVSPILHFGLGNSGVVDSILIRWPGGKEQKLKNVKSNQLLQLKEAGAGSPSRKLKNVSVPLFTEGNPLVPVQDVAGTMNDFKRQPLLNKQFSFTSECLVKGDVNNDGLEDIFAGGSKESPRTLFIQQKNGGFVRKFNAAFEDDSESVDAAAVFVDVNADGHPDLYVASGGYHDFEPDDKRLQDRLYTNDGNGNFTRQINALPTLTSSKSCVAVTDVNGDHYPDLFIGGRVVPGRYPETPESYLLINQRDGTFKNEISKWCPDLQKSGMVTDAKWIDLDVDGRPELVVAGEWMPLAVFEIQSSSLVNVSSHYFDKQYSGWWNKIQTGDFNKDGKPDLVIGNLGLNSQCKASSAQPAEMYFDDFDNNGSVDPVLCLYIQGKSYPFLTRDELLEQLGFFRRRFVDYQSYSHTTLADLFDEKTIGGAHHLVANHFETSLFVSSDSKILKFAPLPAEVQFSPIHAIAVTDFNEDGNTDLILCGNESYSRIKFGKSDANYGLYLQGRGTGQFVYVPQVLSGLKLKGDVREILLMGKTISFGRTGEKIATYSWSRFNSFSNKTALKK